MVSAIGLECGVVGRRGARDALRALGSGRDSAGLLVGGAGGPAGGEGCAWRRCGGAAARMTAMVAPHQHPRAPTLHTRIQDTTADR
jgi:hypothetical protein